MGLAFLAAAGAIAGTSRLERAIRWVFLVCGVLAVGGLVVFAALFGSDLDVRYEVAAISMTTSASSSAARCSPCCSGDRARARRRTVPNDQPVVRNPQTRSAPATALVRPFLLGGSPGRLPGTGGRVGLRARRPRPGA